MPRTLPRTKRALVAALALTGLLSLTSSLSFVGSSQAAESTGPTGTTYQFPDDGYGLQGSGTFTSLSAADMYRELDLVASTTATWLRVPIHWDKIEAKRGTFDWTRTDRVVDAAQARGLKVLGVIAYAPVWARTNVSPTAPPKNLDVWSTWVSTVAERYRGRVVAYEIWNEPNLDSFYGGNANPYSYTPLLQRAYQAVKSVDTNLTVVSGGFSPNGIDPTTFLSNMYKAGASGSFDAVGYHPYVVVSPDEKNFEAMKKRMALFNSIMTAQGDGAKKIWSTEFGSSSRTGWQTLESQAQRALKELRILSEMPYAGPAMLFTIRDTGPDKTKHGANFGHLATYDFGAKPLLTYLADPQ